MNAVTFSNAGKQLSNIMEEVCDSHDPVIITRTDGSPVVMMSLEDYNAIEETMYLLRSPANAAHLRASIAEYEAGKYGERELINDNSVD
ncbi:MAG: type II toxin-antitoxin system prevent-host-death family antitoxin [Desulfobacterales bacterium]|nr:type II toxin-antitoxin system prevent-host-death family antitoxin [Desulfobacterales bacterium]